MPDIYRLIPADTEILLTHTPPRGVLDLTKKRKRVGCKQLAARLLSPDLAGCRLHVFGHIHEAHGADIAPERGGRVSVNAALATGKRPVVVDLLN